MKVFLLLFAVVLVGCNDPQKQTVVSTEDPSGFKKTIGDWKNEKEPENTDRDTKWTPKEPPPKVEVVQKPDPTVLNEIKTLKDAIKERDAKFDQTSQEVSDKFKAEITRLAAQTQMVRADIMQLSKNKPPEQVAQAAPPPAPPTEIKPLVPTESPKPNPATIEERPPERPQPPVKKLPVNMAPPPADEPLVPIPPKKTKPEKLEDLQSEGSQLNPDVGEHYTGAVVYWAPWCKESCKQLIADLGGCEVIGVSSSAEGEDTKAKGWSIGTTDASNFKVVNSDTRTTKENPHLTHLPTVAYIQDGVFISEISGYEGTRLELNAILRKNPLRKKTKVAAKRKLLHEKDLVPGKTYNVVDCANPEHPIIGKYTAPLTSSCGQPLVSDYQPLVPEIVTVVDCARPDHPILGTYQSGCGTPDFGQQMPMMGYDQSFGQSSGCGSPLGQSYPTPWQYNPQQMTSMGMSQPSYSRETRPPMQSHSPPMRQHHHHSTHQSYFGGGMSGCPGGSCPMGMGMF